MCDWHKGNPPDAGYYLAAWWRGKWTVSQAFYAPEFGWTSRYSFHKNSRIKPRAWMPIPKFSAADVEKVRDEA